MISGILRFVLLAVLILLTGFSLFLSGEKS